MKDIDDFKKLLPDVFELWEQLSSQHYIPAAQSARQFIEKMTGTMFYEDWEFQYQKHQTVSTPNDESQLQPQLADAEDEIVERLVRFVMEPSEIRLDFAIKACGRFLQEMDVKPAKFSGSHLVDRAPAANEMPKEPATPRAFSGGPMVFSENQIQLCGVVIDHHKRSDKVRKLLELLLEKRNGSFVPYSGEELAQLLECPGGQNSVGRLVGDLRNRISEALRKELNIECGPEDVILSRGPGYRLKDWITVQDGESAQDQGRPGATTATDDPNRDPNREPNRDPNRDPDDPKDVAATRRRWILQQLAINRRLRAPNVIRQFDCSLATAKRDLQMLKNAGTIEFVGKPRTGYYRLTTPPGQADD